MTPRKRQGGIALLGVLLVLLLALITVYGALRTARLSEALVGYRSSYERTRAQAAAQIREAEDAIEAARSAPAPDLLHNATPWYPQNQHALWILTDRFPLFQPEPHQHTDQANVRCTEGICPGQLPGAGTAPTQEAQGRTPCRHAGGWYWVEFFHFGNHAPPPSLRDAAQPPAAIYRITALAEAPHDGVRVMLQSLYLPFPADLPTPEPAPGQRIGWREPL